MNVLRALTGDCTAAEVSKEVTGGYLHSVPQVTGDIRMRNYCVTAQDFPGRLLVYAKTPDLARLRAALFLLQAHVPIDWTRPLAVEPWMSEVTEFQCLDSSWYTPIEAPLEQLFRAAFA